MTQPSKEVVDFLTEHGIDSLEKVQMLLGPNLYAVIPISILENKDLTPNAKLLYAEVMALSKKSGRCFATNEYLANRLGISPRTVPALLSELNGCGIIHTDVKRNKQGTYRNITVSFFSDVGHRSLTRGGIAESRGQKRNRQIDIEKEKLLVSNESTQAFSLKETLEKWEKDGKRKFDIMAWYIKKKGLKPENREQLQNIVSRNIKWATMLESYKDEQIVDSATRAIKITDEWNLGTVLKLIK